MDRTAKIEEACGLMRKARKLFEDARLDCEELQRTMYGDDEDSIGEDIRALNDIVEGIDIVIENFDRINNFDYDKNF